MENLGYWRVGAVWSAADSDIILEMITGGTYQELRVNKTKKMMWRTASFITIL
jgi:hypothetical protein